MNRIMIGLVLCTFCGCASKNDTEPGPSQGNSNMRLGNFSVSLAVKDLRALREFYEKLGFRAIGGDPAKNWLILQNETSTIGLFQGMFDKNTLTFNPGWDHTGGATLAEFDDVREIQHTLVSQGIELGAQGRRDYDGTGEPDAL